MNATRWWCGYTNFATGIQCNAAWRPWDMIGQRVGDGRLMSQAVGAWNAEHPADAMDGLYSQMFGAGKVHPKTTLELTPAGLFNGGVNRVVSGLVPGEAYLLICWMKYEFRGMQPTGLKFHLGVDPTGQTGNGNAGTINWGTDRIADQAPVHEIFSHVWRTFTPTSNSVSIWLRAGHSVNNPSFMVYVDKVEVKQVTLTLTTVRADFDGDGDVDQSDYGHLQDCYTGSGIAPTSPACEDARLDVDVDVDADDFHIFLGCFGGANQPVSAGCTP
ncbi:MAG: hypothetical protein HY718_03605 [Planctomycetes bacterium]|nr:hypothetical protein [Planctomycetota bacterium]